MAEILDVALAAYDAGVCVIPAKSDGTKAPFGRWTNYQNRLATVAELRQWFGVEHIAGMGVVTGAVSGNLEMFEFEGRAVNEGLLGAYRERLDQTNATAAAEFGRIWDGYAELTPSGGIHLMWRCSTIEASVKLAQRPADPDELTDDERAQDAKRLAEGKPPRAWARVLIETRGEHAFAVVAPSNGTTHPSGGKWEMLAGGWSTVATIAPEIRAVLLEVARSFDTMPAKTPTERPTEALQPREPRTRR